jgi:hypothetical protein
MKSISAASAGRKTRPAGVTPMMTRRDCGNVMDRDRNAAANLSWYPEERENRIRNGPRRLEMGDHGCSGVRQ